MLVDLLHLSLDVCIHVYMYMMVWSVHDGMELDKPAACIATQCHCLIIMKSLYLHVVGYSDTNMYSKGCYCCCIYHCM